MKYFCFLVLLNCFLMQPCDCQTYNQLRDSSAKLREQHNFPGAFRLLSKGISIAKQPFHNDLYDAAALASLTDQFDTAYYYLQYLADAGEYEMITCSAANDSDFKPIHADKRWRSFIWKVNQQKNEEDLRKMASIASCIEKQNKLKYFSDSVLSLALATPYTGKQLWKIMSNYHWYPKIEREDQKALMSFGLKINDSTWSFYNVQLPVNYNPKVSYPLLLVLHGAVFQNTGFPDPLTLKKYGSFDTTGMNQFFSQFGYHYQAIVIYPHANRDFNWMYPDDGFSMVPNIVHDVKRIFNIDDNRVFISGHSNGATGVLSYLLKLPDLFGGFYGFNSNPQVRTGGTFIKNAKDRSYFNVATNKDYYFPISGHDTLAKIADSLDIDWQNHVYKGFPHWFPEFIESKRSFQLMFTDMATRRRNPFQQRLYWECDDIKYGRCDWIRIDKLDTDAVKHNWQTEINFPVTHWINNFDTSKVSDTTIMAFNFPRLSGAVIALHNGNQFHIQTSRVNAITIYLSPEMIDFTKPVVIYVDGKKVFSKIMPYNKEFILDAFRNNFDRKAIWANYIRLQF